jgi:hypothetical protein
VVSLHAPNLSLKHTLSLRPFHRSSQVLSPSATVSLQRSGISGALMPAQPLSFNMLQLELKLQGIPKQGAPGGVPWDSDAPPWDHLVQLFVCCQDPAGQLSCPASCSTVWRRRGLLHQRRHPGQQPGGAPEQEEDELLADAAGAAAASASRRGLYQANTAPCGFEIGRWVTPYMRPGHWMTDISPLIPLFASDK